MSSDEIVIDVKNLSKRYEIYAAPRDRLKQLVVPSLWRISAHIARFLGIKISKIQPQFFKEFWALHNVSFQVKRGETLAIVGRNGSGKSTLLRMICSTLTPTSGDVVASGRISALLELGSGFNPEYTGRENVYLNGQILGLSHKEIEARYDAIIAFADIGDFIGRPVKTYSSGMVVRLAFAVAINVDPEILVIDEALSVGDVGFQARCFMKLNELRDRGVTLLFVSHSPDMVTQLCSRAVLIDHGELLLDAKPYQVIRAYNYLANAGPASFDNVRKEVIALTDLENSNAVTAVDEASIENQSVEPVSNLAPVIEAHFDQQLCDDVKPLVFERRGGEITSISVTNTTGKQVNVLPMHQEFELRFNVEFHSAFKNVRIAWVIKTTNGLILGGGSTHQPGSGFDVTSPSTCQVVSHFVNTFTSGNYLIDIGVRGLIENEDEFIHGISDAIAVRSVSYNRNFRNGVVDCLVEPFFTIEETTDLHAPDSELNVNLSQNT